jgi:hypothetical protein
VFSPGHQRLTQQLIVTLYTAWDAEFRRRVAACHGVPDEAVKADFFGDLRLLRNDIVHHRGRASDGGSTRCSSVVERVRSPLGTPST